MFSRAFFIFLLFFTLIASVVVAQDSHIDELSREIEQAGSDTLKIELKLQLFGELEKSGRYSAAVQTARNILRLSRMIGNDAVSAHTLVLLGDHYLMREMPDSARVPVLEGLDTVEDEDFRVLFLNQLASVSRLEGHPLQSIQYDQEALEKADSLQLDHARMHIWRNLSLSQQMIGDYSAAFENLYNSFLISEELQDSTFIATVLNDIGEMLTRLENPEEGLYYLEESERISREHNLSGNLIHVLLNLSTTHLQRGNTDRAHQQMEEALSLIEESDDLLPKIRVYNHMGELYVELDQPDPARDYFYTALEESETAGFPEGIYHASMGMGSLHLKGGRYQDALQWFRSALTQAERVNDNALISSTLEEIYLAYKSAQQPLQALEALERLTEHNETYRTLEHERSRAEYETLLETRRQEQENRLLMARQAEQETRIQLQQAIVTTVLIVLVLLIGASIIFYRNMRQRESLNRDLKDRNQEITNKNRQLDKLNTIKNRIFAVISHDLRGPMNSLKGLLQLLRHKDPADLDIDKLTENLEKNINDNAATMENLLTWASSQMSGIQLNRKTIDLQETLEPVISQIRFQAERKNIEIHYQGDPDFEFEADPDVIKLVVRNLLSNAVKFCRNGDSITIHADEKGDLVQIGVEDTGVGIPEEDHDKIFGDGHFTKKGTENEKGSGLGLMLCKEFIEKHGGRIWFESRPGEGTTFSFSIPQNRQDVSEARSIEHTGTTIKDPQPDA